MAKRLEWAFEIETDGGAIWEIDRLVRITGIALPPGNRQAQATPTQHGSDELGFRLDDREVVIGAVVLPKYANVGEDPQLKARQGGPYKVLKWGVGPLTLRATLLRHPDTVRELRRCRYGGGVEGDSEARYEDGELLAFRLVGRDPAWYDPDGHTVLCEYGDFSHGLYYSTLALDSADGLTTDGDWFAYPTVTIAGPCTSFDLRSTTTGQRLRWLGAAADGETVVIETNPHLKTVTSDVAGDVRSHVPPGDDLGGFCLWWDPLADDGDNEWTLEVAGMDAGTTFTFAWEDRYQGI